METNKNKFEFSLILDNVEFLIKISINNEDKILISLTNIKTNKILCEASITIEELQKKSNIFENNDYLFAFNYLINLLKEKKFLVEKINEEKIELKFLTEIQFSIEIPFLKTKKIKTKEDLEEEIEILKQENLILKNQLNFKKNTERNSSRIINDFEEIYKLYNSKEQGFEYKDSTTISNSWFFGKNKISSNYYTVHKVLIFKELNFTDTQKKEGFGLNYDCKGISFYANIKNEKLIDSSNYCKNKDDSFSYSFGKVKDGIFLGCDIHSVMLGDFEGTFNWRVKVDDQVSFYIDAKLSDKCYKDLKTKPKVYFTWKLYYIINSLFEFYK